MLDLNKLHNALNNKNIVVSKDIKHSDVIELSFKTVTPLAQISPAGNGQTKRYRYDESGFLSEPFYSSNGFRGFLRRIAFIDLVHHILEKEPHYKPKADETYLYTSGSGGDKKSIELVDDFQKSEKVRAAAPILSLFGAGLSQLSSKAAIDDLVIADTSVNATKEITTAKGVIFRVSKYLDSMGATRKDSLKDDIFQYIIDQEDAVKVSNAIAKEAKEAKKAKSDGVETDAKQQNAQQIMDIEFIIAGTELKSSINPIGYKNFTEIEIGCLISTLVSASTHHIGAYKRYNFGRLDWNVSMSGEKLFTKEVDLRYVDSFTLTISDTAKRYIALYKEFLNNNIKSGDDILISNMIK